jgi:hypothetical protein
MKTISAVGVLALIGLGAAFPASATLVVSHMTSDLDLLALLPEENIAFVAEGRIGDLGGAATFELDLGQSTAAPLVTAQHVWPNSVSESFSLTYDKVSNLARLTVGGTALEYSPDLLFMEIFIRTRAVDEGTSIVLGGMTLNGQSITENCTASGADGLDILRVQAGTLLDGFTLLGNVTMTWSGAAPTQSHLAFQIKVGSIDPQVSTSKTTWGGIKSRFR